MDLMRALCVLAVVFLNFAHQAPVLAVRWVDGGRHLASIARDGSIVLWNVADGTILDRASAAGRGVVTLGKIGDIFAHRGTGREVKAVVTGPNTVTAQTNMR